MAKVGDEDGKKLKTRPKEGLQQRRSQFRSNTAALCLHCEEAHAHAEAGFVNLFEMPDPDPDSLRHMLEFQGIHGGMGCTCVSSKAVA
mmetsp:Transcript_63848/g.139936  ORF Transcript_63848/g.139936 Transcript_63848/m.139936 type:complete len:88 (-) Transcript_63848:445-708(-)